MLVGLTIAVVTAILSASVWVVRSPASEASSADAPTLVTEAFAATTTAPAPATTTTAVTAPTAAAARTVPEAPPADPKARTPIVQVGEIRIPKIGLIRTAPTTGGRVSPTATASPVLELDLVQRALVDGLLQPLGRPAPGPDSPGQRLLERARGEARPGLASPSHLLLLVLVTGNEPACEILTTLGVDLTALAAAARREIDERGATGEHAS